MRTSETFDKIAPALVKALSEIGGAAKDGENDHFKNRYASLESCINAAKPVLSANKLAIMQGPGEIAGHAITITTRIIHESGEWVETDFQIPYSKPDPQAAGSAVTYARRYSLMGMLGIPAVDDDAEQATNNHPVRKSAAQAKRDGDNERIKDELTACADLEQLGAWGAGLPARLAALPLSWADPVQDLYLSRRNEIIEEQHAQYQGGVA